MANIFLSYARDDFAEAQRIAEALHAAGHSVWWDRQLHAGERFSAEINKALKSADFVVVLWSAYSIESAWVQDEAAVGRDTHRLVPVLIDAVEPPLGFRQYHAVDVSRGVRSRRSTKPVVDAISARLNQPGKAAPKVLSPLANRLGWQWLAAGALIAAIAIGLWLILSRSAGEQHSVAIAATGGDMHRSEELSRSIALDLGRLHTGPLGSLSIIPATDRQAEHSDYRVEVGVSGGGSDWRTDLSLRARDHSGFLWTSSIERHDSKLIDIRQEAAAEIAAVLGCAAEVQTAQARLSQQALALYLDGCARLTDYNSDDPGAELFGLFRQLTQKAPNFAEGWAWLALLEAQSFPSVPPREWTALAVSAREHLERAKQVNADLPVVFAAESFLPENYMAPGASLTIMERGLSKFPENALLHTSRANFLARVGRINDGITEAKAALDLNPLSPASHDTYASALAYAGRSDSAFAALRAAEAIWPGSQVLKQLRYRLDLRYGDPRNALQLLNERGSGDARPIPMDVAWQRFLQARMDPSPTKIEAAVRAFRDRSKGGGDWGYMQALGTFGRVDEAFAVMQSDAAIDGLSGSPDGFFRIHMRPIYSDPRFMSVAQRLGLLAYWKNSGIWPDFCREAQPRYDCKKEAAQYR